MSARDRKRTRRAKVYPDSVDEGEENVGYENDDKNMLNKTREKIKQAALKDLSVKAIASAKNVGSRWKKYLTTRRQVSVGDGGESRRTAGMGLDYDIGQSTTDLQDGKPVSVHLLRAHNRNLIEYFAKLAQKRDTSDEISLEFVEKLLDGGANVNCTDKYGQTVLHEAARAWHLDVARFLLEKGAKIDLADNYGRTPLHVAAAVDYPDMVSLLLKKKADKEARTKGEKQTPVHYAAKNDACQSLKLLIREGCEYKNVRDYKGRTPLHIAAELDRSETARLLLELPEPAPAGVEDTEGQAAIVWMIAKMPPVAKLALDQFHTTDRASRKQSYHLQKLEPRKPGEDRDVYPQTAMTMAVRYRRFDLLEHSVLSELINTKWKQYARRGAVFSLIINMMFILLWTLQGVLVEYDVRHEYIMPRHWWRILLFLAAIAFTVWQLKDELSEFIQSKRVFGKWQDWREKEIEKDRKYAHPRWPEEDKYLVAELGDLDKQRPQYFSDFWNIFDWICYTLLIICVITHLIDVGYHTNFIARLHIRIMAITIILIWIRLLKNARAFAYLGPFIVMLTHMINDVVRFALLYLEFFIPFACAFWMMFGGDKTPERYQGLPNPSENTVEVQGMEDPGALMFSLFRLTLVDEYDYDGMKAVDSVMAVVLVTCWLALSAVLMLNLLIALLSDTFQRVYDNAQANAVMQKAITIIGIEEGLSFKKRELFREYIHTENNPRITFYDDDDVTPGGEDLQKVTIQIKAQLDEMEHNLNIGHYFTTAYKEQQRRRNDSVSSETKQSTINFGTDTQHLEKDISTLREQVAQIKSKQDDMGDKIKKDMSTIKNLLYQIAAYHTTPDGQDLEERDGPEMRTYASTHRAAVEPVSAYSAVEPMSAYSALTALPPRPGGLARSLTMASGDAQVLQVRSALNNTLYEEREQMELRRQQELDQLRHQLQQQQHDLSSRDDILSGSHLTVEISDTRPRTDVTRTDVRTETSQGGVIIRPNVLGSDNRTSHA